MTHDGFNFEARNSQSDEDRIKDCFTSVDDLLSGICETNDGQAIYTVGSTTLQSYADQYPRLTGLYDRVTIELEYADDPDRPELSVATTIATFVYKAGFDGNEISHSVIMQRRDTFSEASGGESVFEGRVLMGEQSRQITDAATAKPSQESREAYDRLVSNSGEVPVDEPRMARRTGNSITVDDIDSINEVVQIIRRSDPDLLLRD